MKQKVLLVTIFKVPNYGSVLQAYATLQIIERMGFDCCVLNYDHINSAWSVAHGTKRRGLKNKIGRIIGLYPHHRKEKKLDKFAYDYFHLTPKYYSIEEIEREVKGRYDKYVVGSDQVWNTRFTKCDPVFLLEFVKDEDCDCCAISSSFASKAIDAKFEDNFRKGLRKFKHISVREQNGIEILKTLGISNASLTLDPTLLLSANEWNKLIDKKKDLPEKYILLYMWCYAFEPRPMIFDVLRRYQKELNCPIIALEGYEDCKGKTNLNIIDATDSSISDFLQLFANASLVVTSSFHGTAFALNYGRPLVSITPPSEDDRQACLMKQLNLNQCEIKVLNEKDYCENLNPFYEASFEQEKLNKLRKRSIEIIKGMCIEQDKRRMSME